MNACRLNLKVVPGASTSAIFGWLGDCLKVKVTAPPEKGKANKAVEVLMCEALGLPKEAARIVKGTTSQQKVIELREVSLAEIQSKLCDQVS